MNNETDHLAWLNGNEGEAAQTAYQYFMRPDPNQRGELGDIEEEFDAYTGKVARFRCARIGMTRNAAEANKRDTKVYIGFDGQEMLPHVRLDNAKPLQGWYQPKHNDAKGSRERPCFTEAILTEPYGGYCAVGCAFCYINAGFRGYRGTGLITVPLNYGEQVKGQIAKTLAGTSGYFSSFTDPFTPLERIYHNTEQGARAFTDVGLPLFFLSRLAYPGWAYDLLLLNKHSYAQKSINTPIQADWKRLSPGGISLDEHFAEIADMRKRGIYTSIQVNPIVPGIVTHDNIRELFERLASVGNNHVIVKFVEAGYSWADTMTERLIKRFGKERAGAFADLFTENQAGSQRTICQEYRMEAHYKYRAWATELGMTYASCYEYKKTPDGWKSIGREVTTASQCHGQAVPMYTRFKHTDMFKPVGACAPSGCLYCGDESPTKKARCGSDRFGQAKDLKAADYKHPVAPAAGDDLL